jgi:hypothetical protein
MGNLFPLECRKTIFTFFVIFAVLSVVLLDGFAVVVSVPITGLGDISIFDPNAIAAGHFVPPGNSQSSVAIFALFFQGIAEELIQHRHIEQRLLILSNRLQGSQISPISVTSWSVLTGFPALYQRATAFAQ